MPSFFPAISTHFKFLHANLSARTGIATLTLRLADVFYGFNNASKPAPADLTIIYTLDNRPITGELRWPYSAEYLTSIQMDGYHSLAIILIDAVNPAQYRMLPRQVKIKNGRTKLATAPANGFSNRESNYFTVATDWLPIPIDRPNHNSTAFPVVFSPPANTLADPFKFRNASNWISEPLHQVTGELYDFCPSWYKDIDGDTYLDLYQGFAQPEMEASMARLWKIDFHDGKRNNNSISPYSTYIYDWNSPDIYGIDLIGRFFVIKPDGTVITLLGPRGNPYTIPAKGDPAWYNQYIGTVTDGSEPDLSCSADLTQSRKDPAIFYVPDMDRGRIVKVRLINGDAEMSTYVTGIRIPASLFAMPDDTLVVSEMGTHEHQIARPGIAIVAPDLTIRHLDLTDVNLPNPFCIRPTSDWKIICADQANNHTYEFDPDGKVPPRLITDTNKLGPQSQPNPNKQWTWIAVDRTGAIGPVDDIVWVQYSRTVNITNFRIGRNEPIDTSPRSFWTSSGGYCRVGAAQYMHDQMGHYPWAVAIAERECRILFYGGGGDGLLSFRGRIAADPVASFDLPAFNLGKGIFQRGTINGFPHGMRPTFTGQLSPNGHSRSGVANFDEMATWDNTRLAKWIQLGMGGVVARPEIVGYQLDCLMYFIRMNSTQNLIRRIPPPAKAVDVTLPVISEVVVSPTGYVTWQTSEPTLGYVAFGSSVAFHRWSNPEKIFSRDHQVRLEHMPVKCMASIRCTDIAGNVVFGPAFSVR